MQVLAPRASPDRTGRGVLERESIVALELCVARVRLHVVVTTKAERQKAERFDGRHLREARGHRRALPPLCDAVEPRTNHLAAADEQQIRIADQPRGSVRKRGRERRHDRAQVLLADVVSVRPLAEDAVRSQAVARCGEELAGEERRHAGHPGVRRLRDNHVVGARGQQHVRAAVADHQMRAWIGQGVVVLPGEEAGRRDDIGGDLDDVRAPNRMRQRRAERDAATEADDADLAGGAVDEQRHVRQQLLRQHVAAVRRVHLAINRKRADSRQAPNRYRPGGPIVVVEQASSPQRPVEVERPEVRCVLVRAARHQCRIPAGQRQRRRRDAGCCGKTDGLRHSAASTAQDDEGCAEKHDDRRADCGRVKTETWNEQEAGGQRSGDGAERVHGVDEADITWNRLKRAAACGDRQRHRCAERGGHGHKERRDEPPLGGHHPAERHLWIRSGAGDCQRYSSGDRQSRQRGGTCHGQCASEP